MSSEWVDLASRTDRFKGISWEKTVEVPIVTIDSLCKTYGQPAFIKIDTEGSEEEALKGMSHQPTLVSFEFNTEQLELAYRCIRHPHISSGSQFNYVLGEPEKLELDSWASKTEIESHLSTVQHMTRFGDILVKLV